jgi:hypothetical protein
MKRRVSLGDKEEAAMVRKGKEKGRGGGGVPELSD